jgi:hypothetical protein
MLLELKKEVDQNRYREVLELITKTKDDKAAADRELKAAEEKVRKIGEKLEGMEESERRLRISFKQASLVKKAEG